MPIPSGHAIGLDVGIQSMLATSDGLVSTKTKILRQSTA